MLKSSFYLFLILPFALFSQTIVIDESTYNASQLVNNVLINNPCIPVNNITFRTGTNFGSTNGIGYFTNSNPNFPLKKGIILSTGNVKNSVGPNNSILSDGNETWGGDIDLETNLLTAGVSLNSKNATVLEFDIVPFTDNLQFDFVFVSEEYGTYQCLSPDAFAFLLTDSNGNTRNLAVLPNSTIPISVQTIRDNIYNPSCPTANKSFFGLFNDGSSANNAAINYNGQTVLMTASSNNLIPNTTYHLKLVIADGNNDVEYDSAVFIGGGSFNLAADVLGEDLTIQNGTSLCNFNNTVEPYSITTGLNPSIYNFEWKKNGVTLAGETGPNLIINQPGNYELTYYLTSTSCKIATNNKIIEFSDPITIPSPKNLYKCNSNSSNYLYDLSFNNTILDPQGQYNITYYESESNAKNGLNPLAFTYNASATILPKTLWVKVSDTTFNCSLVQSFQLKLIAEPVANAVDDLYACEVGTNNNQTTFNLNSQNEPILLGQDPEIYTTAYYLNAADANLGIHPIEEEDAFISSETTIYFRVGLITDPNCFKVGSFNLLINQVPEVEQFENKEVCSGYILPPLALGNYFTEPDGMGDALFAGDEILETQSIHIFYMDPISKCKSQSSFLVTVLTEEEIDIHDTKACDSYSLPDYAFIGIRYFSGPGGPNGGSTELFPNSFPQSTPITQIGNTTIYIYYKSPTNPNCELYNSYVVTIVKQPVIDGTYPNLFECTPLNNINALPINVGETNFFTYNASISDYEPVIFPITADTVVFAIAKNENCMEIQEFKVFISTDSFLDDMNICEPYLLEAPPIGEYRTEANGLGTIIEPGLIDTSITIYHYVKDKDCTFDYKFTINAAMVDLDQPEPVNLCGPFLLPIHPQNGRYFKYPGGPNNPLNVELFGNADKINQTTIVYVYKESDVFLDCYVEKKWEINITIKPLITSFALNYIECYNFNLGPLAVGNYYHSQGGVDPITLPYTINAENTVNNQKTIWVYGENPDDPSCKSETSFTVNIDGIAIPEIYKGNKEACDTYTLPILPNNFYYYTAPNGPHGTGQILTNLTITESTTTPIYIYTETNNRRACIDQAEINITINKTPVITPPLQHQVKACNSYTLPTLTVGKYYTGPNGTGTEIDTTTPVVYTKSQPTIYVYAETNTNPNCFVNETLDIEIFNVVEPENVVRCESYNLNEFVLPPGQNYYSQPNGVGLLSPNEVITATQNIYVYGQSNYDPNCSDQHMFTVTIIYKPELFLNALRASCDTYKENDGIFSFDLSGQDIIDEIMNGLSPQEDYEISFYSTVEDANGTHINATPITSLNNYENIVPYNDSVWIRVTNKTLTDPCFSFAELKLKVYPLPLPKLLADYFVCYDYETNLLKNEAILDTGLDTNNYSFEWTYNGEPYGGNTALLSTNLEGIYTLIVKNLNTNCISELYTTNVSRYTPYLNINNTDAFSIPYTVILNVLGTGSGNYEYQIDFNPFQDSNVFNDVLPGQHTFSVRDKDGFCDPKSLNIEVINYPNFFTPNNDGVNDLWNIGHLKQTNPNAKIYIYNKEGKLLKQITPSSIGWDGNYNNQPMPATDYWFSVNYIEKGESKLYKSHFSLKR